MLDFKFLASIKNHWLYIWYNDRSRYNHAIVIMMIMIVWLTVGGGVGVRSLTESLGKLGSDINIPGILVILISCLLIGISSTTLFVSIGSFVTSIYRSIIDRYLGCEDRQDRFNELSILSKRFARDVREVVKHTEKSFEISECCTVYKISSPAIQEGMGGWVVEMNPEGAIRNIRYFRDNENANETDLVKLVSEKDFNEAKKIIRQLMATH